MNIRKTLWNLDTETFEKIFIAVHLFVAYFFLLEIPSSVTSLWVEPVRLSDGLLSERPSDSQGVVQCLTLLVRGVLSQ